MRRLSFVLVVVAAVAGCKKSESKPAPAPAPSAGVDAGAAVSSGGSRDPAAVLAKLEGYRDAACKCVEPTCVHDVEKAMAKWLLEVGPALQGLQGTPAQTEAANKASAAMSACVDKILHPR